MSQQKFFIVIVPVAPGQLLREGYQSPLGMQPKKKKYLLSLNPVDAVLGL